jgi:Ras family protein A
VLQFCTGLPCILVGCKKDLRYDPRTIEELAKTNQHPVTPKEVTCKPSPKIEGLTSPAGGSCSKRIGAIKYMECSALTGEGVLEVFETAARLALFDKKRNK